MNNNCPPATAVAEEEGNGAPLTPPHKHWRSINLFPNFTKPSIHPQILQFPIPKSVSTCWDSRFACNPPPIDATEDGNEVGEENGVSFLIDLASALHADKSNSARTRDGGKVKKMKLQKPSNVLLKVSALFLVLGLGFIISRDSTAPLSRIEIKSPLMEMNDSPEVNPPQVNDQSSSLEEDSHDQEQVTGEDATTEECDLFTGDWIPNPSGPVYSNESCPFIESHQNCMKNGRPDTGYLYWRWNPRHCELHQFDAVRFLELMRSKSWALIGDSISRNHVQSLLCLLAVAEKPIEVYHDEEYKSRTWHFRSYNFTLSVLWSPFLVKAAIYEDQNGVSTSEVKLHLDELDPKWTTIYPNIDYAILSTGKWFLKNAIYYQNSIPVGCHNCDPTRNITELGFDYAYQSTLDMVMSFVATTPNKGMVFFRTSTPDHFEGGEWHNGGTCQKTGPDKEGAVELKDINRILRDIELKEFEKALGVAERNGVNLRLLDFTSLLLKRPDGHPGPYRQFEPFAGGKTGKVQNDCLHWCLPGPIDAWNDVIMDMVVNED